MILLRTITVGFTLRIDIIISCQMLMSARVKMHWIQRLKYRAKTAMNTIAATMTSNPPSMIHGPSDCSRSAKIIGFSSKLCFFGAV